MSPWVAVIVAGGVVLIVALIVRRAMRAPQRRRRRLREEYARRVGLPPAQAYEALEHRVETLMQTHPGHTLEWYFDYVLAELKRDRR